MSWWLREGVHRRKKTFLNGHCPDRSDPPLPRGATGNVVLFFSRQKTTFKRVLRNQIPIKNYDENDEYNGDNFDADEQEQEEEREKEEEDVTKKLVLLGGSRAVAPIEVP